MKIAIVDGISEADFLISSLKDNNKISVINRNEEYAQFLADKHSIPVTHGDPCKEYILRAAEIVNFDVLISLSENDADNLAICQIAKDKLNIKKTVAVVENPRNVDLFKTFGVTEVISSAYLASRQIAKISTLENLVNSFSIEESNIEITEIDVAPDCKISNISLSEMKLPSQVIIACIIRNGSMIVPNGRSFVKGNDRLIIVSPSETQNFLINLFTKGSAA